MLLLDTVGSSAVIPWGLYVVAGVEFVLSLPLLLPLSQLALHFGFIDPINDMVYWVMPLINSAAVALLFGVALRWWRGRRTISNGHVA